MEIHEANIFLFLILFLKICTKFQNSFAYKVYTFPSIHVEIEPANVPIRQS